MINKFTFDVFSVCHSHGQSGTGIVLFLFRLILQEYSLQMQLLRTTVGSMNVCLYVCMPQLTFLPFTKKNLQATHTWKFVTLLNIFLRMPLWKKNCFTPSHSTSRTPRTKYFFCFNQKIFLQIVCHCLFRAVILSAWEI